jgi:hypothetical protein
MRSGWFEGGKEAEREKENERMGSKYSKDRNIGPV